MPVSNRPLWPALACFLISAGCGYVGDPLPPALDIPEAITDLRAVQRADRIVVDFTVPSITTEKLPLTKVTDIELRIGPGGDPPFDVNQWAATAALVPSVPLNVGPISTTIPAKEWVGKEVFLAVRAAGPKKRRGNWSNIVALQVVAPVPAPVNLAAEDTADGVRLTWQGRGGFRVFRRAATEKEFAQIGRVDKPEFVDTAFEYGQKYEYLVQGVAPAGAGEAESELSEVAGITPEDRFPPPVPTGLSALGGTRTIELVWNAVDAKDIAGYVLYRAEANGALTRIADRVEAPSFSDSTIKTGVTYRYAVASVDVKGNESAPSPTVEIAVPAQ
ncbi:MAG: hypothetical protein IRZ15_05795 [Bryobacteraceae bacterium]|nr:hypothetical protein [Bryobacteraceae bacterium]